MVAGLNFSFSHWLSVLACPRVLAAWPCPSMLGSLVKAPRWSFPLLQNYVTLFTHGRVSVKQSVKGTCKENRTSIPQPHPTHPGQDRKALPAKIPGSGCYQEQQEAQCVVEWEESPVAVPGTLFSMRQGTPKKLWNGRGL